MKTPIGATANAVALFFAALIFLSSCQTVSVLQNRDERARNTAAENGWVPVRYSAGRFSLQGYRPAQTRRSDLLAVYLEGDGVAWATPTVKSSDPTPDDTLTLEMAIQDPTPNRLYLARPCQFLSEAERRTCSPDYWTSHRYAPEIVDSVNEAVEQEKQRTGSTRIALFGYSGGGGLALLIAERRKDVSKIVTVAGNLDHVAWTRHHRDSPLTGSLNPADTARQIALIPQIHFVGTEDETVPKIVANAYLRKAGPNPNIAIIDVPDVDHTCCWNRIWPELLRRHIYP